MDDNVNFLETFKPLHSKGIETKLEERTFPIGVVCAIISKYSLGEVPLFDGEDFIERNTTGFKFLESSKISPWCNKTILDVMFTKQMVMCDYHTTLELMEEFIDDLKEK